MRRRTVKFLVALLLLATSLPTRAQPVEEEVPRLSGGANLHTLWTLSPSAGDPANEFEISMARVKLLWREGNWLRARLQFDADQTFDSGPSGKPKAALRDCWIELRFYRSLRLKMGQFKRQFSALELRGRSSLEVIGRGPANGLLIEDLGFGDRDLGLQLSGAFGPNKRQVNYALGLFNGPGRNRPETDANGAKDVVGRVEAKARKWLTFGANASAKFFDTDSVDYYPSWSWMAGVDMAIERKGLYLLVEGLYGLNHDRCALAIDAEECRTESDRTGVPGAAAAVLLAAYRIKLGTRWELALEPVIKGELLLPDDGLSEAFVGQGSVGANLHIGKHVRLMVHGDIRRVDEALASEWSDESRLFVQLALRL
jgi:hypothetical protein